MDAINLGCIKGPYSSRGRLLKGSKSRSPQIRSSQIRSPQIRRSQIWSPQIWSPQIRSPQIWSPKIRSPQIRRSQIWSPQIRSPQIRSPQFRFPQIRSPKFRSPQGPNSLGGPMATKALMVIGSPCPISVEGDKRVEMGISPKGGKALSCHDIWMFIPSVRTSVCLPVRP
jgi:hypothetical protein